MLSSTYPGSITTTTSEQAGEAEIKSSHEHLFWGTKNIFENAEKSQDLAYLASSLMHLLLVLSNLENSNPSGGSDVEGDYFVEILVEPDGCSQQERGVILVHSFAGNFQLRQSQRKAKALWVEAKRFKHVFVLFHSSEVDMEEVQQEWEEHKDILLGDKEEGYRVLAYKHLAGLRWVNEKCDRVETVIKMDDDIFVDFAQILPKGKASKYMKFV